MTTQFDTLIEILAYIMLLMGVLASLTRTIQRMIRYYQYLCAGLAFITLFTAIELGNEELQIVSGVYVIIPILLALSIRPLLVQATVMENAPVWKRVLRWFNWRAVMKASEQTPPDWLQTRRAHPGILNLLVVDMFIVALSFFSLYSLVGAGMRPVQSLVLAVSFSLLLLGLSTMVNAGEIISQVSGLLVMEQGMFLATVRCIPNNEMRIVFVFGLFFYMIITLTILVILLPDLHQKSGSLDIDQQAQLKG